MAIKDAFISELKYESELTRKMLERVPLDKKDWKPHDKSMSLGRLATHVAETTGWASRIATADEFNFATANLKRVVATDQEELMGIFRENLDNAVRDLSAMSDDDFNKHWVVKFGDKVVFDTPKKVALRGWAFSHMIHHRGQLSVYLRLLDVPVPGMYGPSADEN